MIANLQALRRLFPGTSRWLALGSALALLQAALLIPVALLIKRAFDETIPDGDTGGLVLIGVALLGLFLAWTPCGNIITLSCLCSKE